MIDVPTLTLDEPGLARLAEALALKLAVGDCVALHGDLGAGKTTFARAFIRAALGEREAEVPSPTFPIEQQYQGPRGLIAHYDLYRLSGADDLEGIGFSETQPRALTLIEWPGRAEDMLPTSRLDVTLAPGPSHATRRVSLHADGPIAARVSRALDVRTFLDAAPAPWNTAWLTHAHGDASVRSYGRLVSIDASNTARATSAILMDAPRQPSGPPIRDGKPYSQIARLAEDVAPFVAIGGGLRASGLAACEILAQDLERGCLVVEDFGDTAFVHALADGADQDLLWSAAVDVLLALRRKPVATTLPLPGGRTHTLPRFDRAALEIETELILDWYWPALTGAAAPDVIREEFRALWSPVLDRMLAEPTGIFLRDFHSPNLFWRPHLEGTDRVGLIDFQDALAEPWAYDLVSLLQDARVDVSADLERREYQRYIAAVRASETAFDAGPFAAAYAAFGAQRNTRLIGLWVRLLRRDGKPDYLQHMQRTWDYLARNLAHPTLAPLRAFYAQHMPVWTADRSRQLVRG